MAEKTVPVTTEPEVPQVREETRGEEAYLQPPVDIYETDEGLVVMADLPGVDKDQLSIHVDKGILTIEGRTRHIAPGQPVWAEYRLLNFYRRFELPDEVDQDKISAELKHGVLMIHLPKAEAAKPRKIDVRLA
jgi:HSP20 family molecular chaperone IbpA